MHSAVAYLYGRRVDGLCVKVHCGTDRAHGFAELVNGGAFCCFTLRCPQGRISCGHRSTGLNRSFPLHTTLSSPCEGGSELLRWAVVSPQGPSRCCLQSSKDGARVVWILVRQALWKKSFVCYPKGVLCMHPVLEAYSILIRCAVYTKDFVLQCSQFVFFMRRIQLLVEYAFVFLH